MHRQTTPDIQMRPTTNPKARGSNPLGRVPTTTHADSDSSVQLSPIGTKAKHLGTQVGHGVWLRSADWCIARQRFLESTRRAGSLGCLEWTGRRDSNGYGVARRDGRDERAHRIAFEFAYGPIPAGLLVCHHCDNPPCIEASHLFAGTCRDNIADMRRKGRGADQKALRAHIRALVAFDSSMLAAGLDPFVIARRHRTVATLGAHLFRGGLS